MIHFLRGVFEARPDVIGFQVGKIFKDFALRHAGGQQIEHVLDPNTHPPNARPSAALVGIEGDAFHKSHVRHLTLRVAFLKHSFIQARVAGVKPAQAGVTS